MSNDQFLGKHNEDNKHYVSSRSHSVPIIKEFNLNFLLKTHTLKHIVIALLLILSLTDS